MKPIQNYLYMCIFFLFLSSSSNSPADEHPVWWDQVANEAQRNGYSLVTLNELKKLYDSETQFLIIDVRTDYEYNDGHLPRAVCLEFYPGDKLQLTTEKKEAFLKVLGADQNRKIIIYCRGFR